MKRIFSLFLITALYLTSSAANAMGKFEQLRRDLLVHFANGDSIAIRCDYEVSGCSVYLYINRVAFQFSEKDLGDLSLRPDRAELYTDSSDERQTVFSFTVSVDCPEVEGETKVHRCNASSGVVDGKLVQVRVVRINES